MYDQIKSQAPTPIQEKGKIFIIGDKIFITEKNKGVHIINNSNPLLPINEAFIPIPGTEDVVVKGNILLADCFIDLLSIDISNPSDSKLINIAENVFPERRYVNGYSLDSNLVITDWITKDTTTTIEYYNHFSNSAEFQPATLGTFDAFNGSGVSGVGGSMARFTIVNQYLYSVTQSTLKSFDIADPKKPVFKNSVNVGWNIETIYPMKNNLFIGSQTGMYIYSLTDQSKPQYVSMFSHANVCDPVIANDQYAFVTLRSGTTCQGFLNELNILDISVLNNPTLIAKYNMTNPHGLTKDGDYLFICDGDAGVKIYDASNVHQLILLNTIPLSGTYDIIAFNHQAYISADNGLFQYDYSDINNIKELGKLTLKH